MNHYQLVKLLQAKREYNRVAMNKRRVTPTKKQGYIRETTSIDAILNDINNDLPFHIADGFVSTPSAKVKL